MKDIAIEVLENHARAGSWGLDLDTGDLWWSHGIYVLFGLSRDTYTPTLDSSLAFFDPESQDRLSAAIERARTTGEGWSATLSLCRADGARRFVHSVGRVERRPGHVGVIAGALIDMHEQTLERIAHESADEPESGEAIRWRMAAESQGLSLLEIDFDDDSLCISGMLARLVGLGQSPDETNRVRLSRDDWPTLIHPDDRAGRRQRLDAHCAGALSYHVCEYRLCLSDGSTITVRETGRFINDGQRRRLDGTLLDITERKRNERALFEAKQLAEVTFEAIGEGVIRVDAAGYIIQINSAACALIDSRNDQALGRRFADVVTLLSAEHEQRLADPVAHVIATGERIRAPIFTRLQRTDGDCISIVDSASPVRDQSGRICGAVFVFRDVSDARRMTDKLDYQARHDDLTGLLNRRGFEQALVTAWRAIQSGEAPMHVLYLDLDHFKAINDLSGHAVGDEMLRQVAAALRATLRSGDIMARVGGDEFAAIAHVGDDGSAELLARRLIARIRKLRFSLDGKRHDAGASVGIARMDAAAQAWGTALMRADAALYVAKDAGRNRYHLYGADTSTATQAAAYLNTTQLLQAGFDENRFALYLQDIVDASARPLGFEVLLRYEGSVGVVPPDVFLPTAKCLGMMSRIDCWVVERALQLIHEARAAAQWEESWYLSVNLSPVSLADPGFHAEVISLIERYEPCATHVAFEIIESDELYGEHYVELIDDLRRRGIRVWLDDFASGYNSFNTLKQVSVDGIKIDRSFVQDIERNPIDRAVLRSIGDISNALALDVVAEGVETAETLELLRVAGFSRFQGFHFHRPQVARHALARHVPAAG